MPTILQEAIGSLGCCALELNKHGWQDKMTCEDTDEDAHFGAGFNRDVMR